MLNFIKTNIAQDEFTENILDAVDIAYKDEEWSMAAWTIEDEIQSRADASYEEGEAAGIAEGEARAESREQRLVETMNAKGLSMEEQYAILIDPDRKAIYERFGIE